MAQPIAWWNVSQSSMEVGWKLVCSSLHQHSTLGPAIADLQWGSMSLDIWLQEVGAKRALNGVRNTNTKKTLLSTSKSAQKPTFFWAATLHPLLVKVFLIWDHFFPLLFPKDSKNLKILDIGLREVGTKRRLNRVNKQKKSVKKQPFFAAAILDNF